MSSQILVLNAGSSSIKFAVFNTGPATALHLPDTAPGWQLVLDTTQPDLPEEGQPAAAIAHAPAQSVLLFRSVTGKPKGVEP